MSAIESAPAPPQTVLVVEDDEGLAHLIQRMLKREGLNAVVLGSGSEALAWMAENRADLMVVDYSLPDMRADQLMSALDEHGAKAPFIVATGHGSETIAVEMMKRGARDYLVKGVTFLDLLGPRVRGVLAEVEKERLLARAERALRESEERLRTVIEASNAGIWEWDVAAARGDWSDEVYKIMGVSPTLRPIDRATILGLIHPQDLDPLADYLRREQASGAPLRREFRVLRPDGECRWVTVSAKARQDVEGRPVRIAGSVLDITDRKRAELSLVARAKQQAAVAALGQRTREGAGIRRLFDDAVQVVVETLEVDGALIHELQPDDSFKSVHAAGSIEPAAPEGGRDWGPRAQARLTLSTAGPVIVANYALDERFAASGSGELSAGGGVTVLIHGFARPYGVLGSHTAKPRAFSEDDMHFLQSVANVLADAIERKRAEEEARQKRTQLAHVMRLNTMGKMVSELAHEINQPLYAIANYAAASREMLQSQGGEAPPEIRLWNQHISEQANRAGEILRRLGEFVRKEPPRQAVVALDELVRKIVGLVEIDARVNKTEIALELDTLPLPALVDRVQIEQVVVNLVVNAIEAMQTLDPSQRRVAIRSVQQRDADRSRGQIEVADAGIGVTDEQFLHLFDAFFTTKPNGMGMGLPISRSIIEAHNGELWAIRNPSGGMIFRFWLPLIQGDTQDGN